MGFNYNQLIKNKTARQSQQMVVWSQLDDPSLSCPAVGISCFLLCSLAHSPPLPNMGCIKKGHSYSWCFATCTNCICYLCTSWIFPSRPLSTPPDLEFLVKMNLCDFRPHRWLIRGKCETIYL